MQHNNSYHITCPESRSDCSFSQILVECTNNVVGSKQAITPPATLTSFSITPFCPPTHRFPLSDRCGLDKAHPVLDASVNYTHHSTIVVIKMPPSDYQRCLTSDPSGRATKRFSHPVHRLKGLNSRDLSYQVTTYPPFLCFVYCCLYLVICH